jgi:hypothetical protein
MLPPARWGVESQGGFRLARLLYGDSHVTAKMVIGETPTHPNVRSDGWGCGLAGGGLPEWFLVQAVAILLQPLSVVIVVRKHVRTGFVSIGPDFDDSELAIRVDAAILLDLIPRRLTGSHSRKCLGYRVNWSGGHAAATSFSWALHAHRVSPQSGQYGGLIHSPQLVQTMPDGGGVS